MRKIILTLLFSFFSINAFTMSDADASAVRQPEYLGARAVKGAGLGCAFGSHGPFEIEVVDFIESRLEAGQEVVNVFIPGAGYGANAHKLFSKFGSRVRILATELNTAEGRAQLRDLERMAAAKEAAKIHTHYGDVSRSATDPGLTKLLEAQFGSAKGVFDLVLFYNVMHFQTPSAARDTMAAFSDLMKDGAQLKVMTRSASSSCSTSAFELLQTTDYFERLASRSALQITMGAKFVPDDVLKTVCRHFGYRAGINHASRTMTLADEGGEVSVVAIPQGLESQLESWKTIYLERRALEMQHAEGLPCPFALFPRGSNLKRVTPNTTVTALRFTEKELSDFVHPMGFERVHAVTMIPKYDPFTKVTSYVSGEASADGKGNFVLATYSKSSEVGDFRKSAAFRELVPARLGVTHKAFWQRQKVEVSDRFPFTRVFAALSQSEVDASYLPVHLQPKARTKKSARGKGGKKGKRSKRRGN